MEPVFEAQVGSGYTANQADIVVDTHAVSEWNANYSPWLYSIEIVSVENNLIDSLGDKLVEVAATVRQNVSDGQRPVVCRLVRWLAIEPEEDEEYY